MAIFRPISSLGTPRNCQASPPFSGVINNNQPPSTITISGNVASNSGLTGASAFIKGGRGVLNIPSSLTDPGHLLVSSYFEATGDVYGLGQYSGGATRIFHSNVFAPSFTAISTYLGNNQFTDVLVVRSNTQNVGIGVANPTDKLHVSGNVSASLFKGNASLLTGLTNAQLRTSINIPGSITSNSFILANGVQVTGNVTAAYLFGNASQLTGLANAQLPTSINLPGNITSNSFILANGVQVSGNVNASYLFGNASQLTGLPPFSGVLNNNQLPTTINIAGNITSNSFFIGNIQQASAIQNSQLPANIAISGVMQAGAFITSGAIQTTTNFFGNISQCTGLINSQLPSSINVPGSITANTAISTIGNVTTPLFMNAGYFVGNGSLLTSITA